MKKTIFLLLGALFLFTVADDFVQGSETGEKITKIGEVTRGANVTLKGQVTRILDDDEFRLTDETGSIRIYIGWRNRVMVKVGETVTVRGFVDDDLINVFRPEVYANELVREDGTVIRLN